MHLPNTWKESGSSPPRNHYAVTPHNTNEIGPYAPKVLYVKGGGDLVLRCIDATDDVTVTVAANTWLELTVQYIRATGTTATGIVAFY